MDNIIIDDICNDLMRIVWEINLQYYENESSLGKFDDFDVKLKTLKEKLIYDIHSKGISWKCIGEQLGISKQAAWERYHNGN